MSRSTSVRSQRIELRTKPEIKSIIERAAHLRHTSLSTYMLETALQRAEADLKETETIRLTDVDRELFFSLLSSPPRPNKALRSLFTSSEDGRE